MTAPPRVRRDCRCLRARHQHGTTRAYQSDGCRCEDCTEATRVAYHRRKRAIIYGRHQFVRPAVGTTRRLRALSVLGWNIDLLAAECEVARSQIRRLRDGTTHVVQPRVAVSVQRAYDRLWNQQPPMVTRGQRRNVTVVRTYSLRKGWLPPLALDDDTIDGPPFVMENTKSLHPQMNIPGYIPQTEYADESPATIDEIAVAETIHGRRVRLTKAEVAEVVRRMTACGYSAEEIAERVGTTSRTVQRKRSAAA